MQLNFEVVDVCTVRALKIACLFTDNEPEMQLFILACVLFASRYFFDKFDEEYFFADRWPLIGHPSVIECVTAMIRRACDLIIIFEIAKCQSWNRILQRHS